MYARAAPPGRAGIALVALNGGQNVENANGLTVARLPDAESTALRFNFAVGQAPFPGDPTERSDPSRSVRAALWR